MKKLLALTLVMVLAFSLLTACGGNSDSNNTPSSGGDSSVPPASTSTPASNSENAMGAMTVVDGVFASANKFIIEITDYRVIPVGSPEHMDAWTGKPILVIMFSYTNTSNIERDPLLVFNGSLLSFNDEKMESRCPLAGVPDEFMDVMMGVVAPGETIEGAVCYVLDEDTVTVTLRDLMSEIGVMTLDLEGH
ncbi:MAG: DUF5067 domain-containing protein [Clostridiales bacterium]|nr:DUF5067 domain-containing protein [Clostridiales bacterium]